MEVVVQHAVIIIWMFHQVDMSFTMVPYILNLESKIKR